MAATKKAQVQELPPLVKPSDLKWPQNVQYRTTLTFHKTRRFGWIIATMPIRKGRNGFEDRTYGIAVNGDGVVRVGCGPHITATVRVIVTKANESRLARHLELYAEGVERAGDIRDTISTRRAMSAMRRNYF